MKLSYWYPIEISDIRVPFLDQELTPVSSVKDLSLVSIWPSGSSRLSQKNVQTIGTIIWKRYPDDCKRTDDWDDFNRLVRIEFYPDDWDDHVNFEAIRVVCDRVGSVSIWSIPYDFDRFDMIFETTGTIWKIIWKLGFTSKHYTGLTPQFSWSCKHVNFVSSVHIMSD